MDSTNLSPGCVKEIDSLLSRMPISHPPTGYAIVIFAYDDGPDTRASLYTVVVPTDMVMVQAMLDGWGERAVCSGGDAVMDLAFISDDLHLDPRRTGINLGCWLVAWMYSRGLSLEEQLKQRQKLYLFILRGQEFKFVYGEVIL